MNKYASMIFLFSVVLLSTAAFAEEPQEASPVSDERLMQEMNDANALQPRDEAPKQGMRQEAAQGGMKGKGMGMMMGMHQKPTVTATSDGGIVVLNGDKISKYDAQLNLIKTVELPHDKKPQPDMKEPAKESAPADIQEVKAELPPVEPTA